MASASASSAGASEPAQPPPSSSLPPRPLTAGVGGIQEKMQGKLLELRLPALLLGLLAAVAFSLLRVGPSLHTVVSFFWPLLVSTALFLAAVAVLRVISPPPAEAEVDKAAGADLIEYVAGAGAVHHEVVDERAEAGGEGGEVDADHRKAE